MTHQIKHHDLAKRPSFNTKNELVTQGCGCKKKGSINQLWGFN